MALKGRARRPYPRVTSSEYRRIVQRVKEVVGRVVPRDATVLVVTRGDDALVRLDQRVAWHFPRDPSGGYAGHHPRDDSAAIAHLEELRNGGARYLVFPRTSLWWLDHYAGLRAHLENRYSVVADENECVVFELSGAVATEPAQMSRQPDSHNEAARSRPLSSPGDGRDEPLAEIVLGLLPPGASIALVGAADDVPGALGAEGGRVSAIAVGEPDATERELEQAEQLGARYLVLTKPALRWLESAPQLRERLERDYALVMRQSEVCEIRERPRTQPQERSDEAAGAGTGRRGIGARIRSLFSRGGARSPAKGTEAQAGDPQRAAWLTRDVLMLALDGDLPEGSVAGSLDDDGRREPVAARHRAGLALVHLPSRQRARLQDAELVLGAGREVRIPGHELGDAAGDVRGLVRRHLAPLTPATRNAATHFLATAAGSFEGAGGERLSGALHRLRGALREHLVRQGDGELGNRGLGVDRLLSIDARSFYLYGWMGDSEGEIVRLTAVSPEGERVDLTERAFRYPRPEVAELFGDREDRSAGCGLICNFQLDAPSHRSQGWLLEMEDDREEALEIEAPELIADRESVAAGILEDPYQEQLQDDGLMAGHVVPAMTRLQEQVEAHVKVASVTPFGEVPRSPDVSVVVPLYRRVDLIEYQLARLADDPDFADAELIYVLDSPEQREELLQRAVGVSSIYRVPFQVCVLERNVGFAGACNAGASVASGRLLVLLNSDVLPARPGWLGDLRSFHDETPGVGAVGPKLVYEDDTIQDAGMYFHRLPASSVWQDAHYFKCLHKSFPAANVTRVVPGLSGACMMIDRALYERLGGLRGIYVRGDYEDFDLCLRLAEAGLDCWYLSTVELYHLEALSYSGDVRVAANRYNAWLHTQLWGDRIEAIMSASASSDGNSARPAPDLVPKR